MKVAVVFLLAALALLTFPGSTTADTMQQKTNYKDAPIACPMIYSPVCGTDGKQYSNECLLRSQTKDRKVPVQVKHYGPC